MSIVVVCAIMNDDDGDGDDVRDFFLKAPISQAELDSVGSAVQTNLERVIERMEVQDNLYQQYRQPETINNDTLNDLEMLNESCCCCDQEQQLDPRSYQLALLEQAKRENTIVHLGTGAGYVTLCML